MIDLNMGIKHLAFDVNQQHIWAIHLNLHNNEISYVTKEIYATFITQMEARCKIKYPPPQLYPLNNLNFGVCFVALN
jgi:hypothetical protein